MNKVYKNSFTDYGIKVKSKLLSIGKTQNWLIEKLQAKTNMFVDNSLLNKILTGRANSETLVTAINEILKIKE